MMSYEEVSVVIPAKNEESTLYSVVTGVRETIPGAEIIVVDDGSTDSSAEIAKNAGAMVISHPYSMGNGAAIKSGTRHASGKILIFMDADGQHHACDIPKMLSYLDDGYDLIVGARTKSSQANIGRSIANRFYNNLASFMTGHVIEDLTSGFRVVKANCFREFLAMLPNGFSYPTTSTMAFFRAGYSVKYVPIEVSKRTGKSHINVVRDGVKFLLIIFKIGTLYSPLKLFFPISVTTFGIGAAYYMFTYFTLGRFTNMSGLLFSTAVLIFLMGLISEQITQLMYKDVGSKSRQGETEDEN